VPEPIRFTLHLLRFYASELRYLLHTCGSIHQPIPSTAVFSRHVRPYDLVELPSVVVVEVVWEYRASREASATVHDFA